MKKLLLPAMFLMLAAPLFAIGVAEDRKFLLYDEDFEPAVGEKLVSKTTMAMKLEKMVVKVAGQQLPAAMDSKGSETKEIEILGKEKVRIVIKKSSDVKGLTVAGDLQPEDEAGHPLLGTPVIGELVDDEWVMQLEEGEPNEAQVEELEEMAENANEDGDKEIYGARPRRVGEQWEVDASLMPGFDGGEMTGKMIMKIVGERQFGGQHCVEIEGTIDAVMKREEEGQKLSMHLKGKIAIYRSLEEFTDLKYGFDGVVEFKGEFGGEGPPVKMEGAGPCEFSGLSTIERPVGKR